MAAKVRKNIALPGKTTTSPAVPTKSLYKFVEKESARTPVRPRERIIGQFRSPMNLAYLKKLFSKLPKGQKEFAVGALEDAVYNYDRATEVLGSDPIAMRGANRPAFDFWSEVRRLNAAFVADRMKMIKEYAHLLEKKKAPRVFADDEDEPYSMRMFISDSLRPPGLEHLNTPGPLYGIREDQTTSELVYKDNKWVSAPSKESFTDSVSLDSDGKTATAAAPKTHNKAVPKAAPKAAPKTALKPQQKPADVLGLFDPDSKAPEETDDAWDEGSAIRKPEQAMAEYWGEDKVPTDTMQGKMEQEGPTYGSKYAWGNNWYKNGGNRFMRYEAIPFWQKGGREGYDYDIEETLGTSGRELDAHVRRWDMDRVRKPGGEEYRRFGQRSGYIS
jgi:hypothetical protein